jgi:pseudaminic acid cytidylyltransferase
MKLCIIPARGGSKRIPRKNIKLFCGKPMIEWSINAALQSGCFDQVIVSTDDAEISELAQQCGAQVPFIRPATLSDDFTGTMAVIAHALAWFDAQDQVPDQVCCLYPTAPFVSGEDLRTGLKVLTESEADYAFSVTSYAFPIQRAIRITAEQRVEMFTPDHMNSRSQDLEAAFHDAGQFYWGRASAWREGKMILSQASMPVLLPRHRVQDIDTIEDWVMAEYLYHALKLKNHSYQSTT